MEEVVGSIPTRSTISLNKLGAMNGHSGEICVMSCVITRCFGARSEGFHRIALGFHSHVTIAFQHAATDVPGNRHNR